MLLCLPSSLATLVIEAVRLKFEFWQFLKILYPVTCKCFVIFNVSYSTIVSYSRHGP